MSCERCVFSLTFPIVSTSLHFSLFTGFGGGLLPALPFTCASCFPFDVSDTAVYSALQLKFTPISAHLQLD